MNNPVTMNRYTYANNNPVGYVDYSGHFANLTKELVCENIANTLIHSIDTIIVTAEMGAIIGAIDAKLSGNDIETGIINGLVNGATIGTVFPALGIVGACVRYKIFICTCKRGNMDNVFAL